MPKSKGKKKQPIVTEELSLATAPLTPPVDENEAGPLSQVSTTISASLTTAAPLSAPFVPMADEKVASKEKEERKLKIAKYVTVGIILTGAVIAETVYTLTTGQSYFLGTINQAGEAIRSVDKFKDFFENNPLGQTIENGLEFLGSKPVKRAIRLAVMTSAFLAADIATTGGALTLSGLLISGTGMVINSIREYRSQKRMDNRIQESKNLQELRKGLAIQKAKGLSPELTAALGEFILGPDVAPLPKKEGQEQKKPGLLGTLKKAYQEAVPKFYRDAIRSLGVNFIESVGALFTGDFRDFGALLGMGTYRETTLKFNHDKLKEELISDMEIDKKVIGYLCDRKGPFNYRNSKQLQESLKKQQALDGILEQIQKEGIAGLTAQELTIKLNAAYQSKLESEQRQATNEYNEMSTLGKAKFTVISTASAIADSKFVTPVIGYLQMWNPLKRYKPEAQIDALHERRHKFSNDLDKIMVESATSTIHEATQVKAATLAVAPTIPQEKKGHEEAKLVSDETRNDLIAPPISARSHAARIVGGVRHSSPRKHTPTMPAAAKPKGKAATPETRHK